ncbi:hypothetical protein SAMN05192533_103167 [Mesobacillus persicus]|uniref:Uncharacterized protein n=1 Tax=Mesobacillus persicus TaxID=930146 RepID=A0A1H7YWS3_9BACI|nr:hypothetical protein [Mesobacillus persicus]SEM50361.1 hypothetical protein SAMN05192533_103167 [Mesobacillus persicus]
MNKFRVCYILEDKVKTENIVKSLNINAGQIFEELVKKIATSKYLKIESEEGRQDRLDTSCIRYIRVTALNE